jgi:hypothetical protein
MTFLEAAETVLRSARRPLTAGEITKSAIERGLIQPHGKTPALTMSARLYEAPVDSPIRRKFEPGKERAIRGSVQWMYVGKKR